MKTTLIKRVWLFYYEGFKGMTLGKTLWVVILIKLFIIFFVLKLFFFKSELSKYNSPAEKSNHVIEEITNRKPLN